MAQEWNGNMGPFRGLSLKGDARVNAVPMFVDKLPLTLGGIAGESIPFGRVVSINPASNRREFFLGCPDGYIVKGIAMMDPTIMRVDPAMQNYYFAGRPMTVTTFGILDILEYDLGKSAPFEGAKVGYNKTTGEIQFGEVEVQLNAGVYETLDPNGAKVFFNFPLDYAGMDSAPASETLTACATPAISTDDGVLVITCATAGAKILYTLDGTKPDWGSEVYKDSVSLDSSCTIKAMAVCDGYNPSSVVTSIYTGE